MAVLKDELLCLEASYSEKEFNIVYADDKEMILKFTLLSDQHINSEFQVDITFQVPASYPTVVPQIAINCPALTKSQAVDIVNEIYDCASLLIGSPMLMDLVSVTKEKISNVISTQVVSELDKKLHESNQESFLTILSIDHMRSKSSYIKTLQSWASDLNVCGVLLLCQKKILLILQSSKECIKNYLVRLKTNNIDVDSSGKKCKEKMSKILFEGQFSKCFDGFSVEELENYSELERYLKQKNLDHIYSFDFIRH